MGYASKLFFIVMSALNKKEMQPLSMSFALTIAQIKAREKTVTRRVGWSGRALKPGDQIYAVEKTTGLKKNEKEKRLATLEVISVREEPLNAVTKDDVIKEGFPEWNQAQFVAFLCGYLGIEPKTQVSRIEFAYLPEKGAQTLQGL